MMNLNRDELFLVANILELPDLLNFCATSRKIKTSICDNNNFWSIKLREFPEYGELNLNLSLKNIYILMYNLNFLREKLDIKTNNKEILHLVFSDVFDPIEKSQISLKDLYFSEKLEIIGKQKQILPKQIGVLINLKRLDLSGNLFKIVPKEIGNLTNLVYLYLQNNLLEEIPIEIKNLKNLRFLYLQNNNISILPEEIYSLTNLNTLDLKYNKIKSISENIKNLINLENLELSGNKLRELPIEISYLPKLKYLFLSSDQMDQIVPKELLNKKNFRIFRIPDFPTQETNL